MATLPHPSETQVHGLTQWAASSLRVGRHRHVQVMFWVVAALLTSFLAYVARMHRIDHDAFHEMALFREYLVQHSFPVNDLFAYTPTVNPTVHHEWGTGAVLYFVTIGTGLGAYGISILRLLLIAALWLGLYRVARMRGAHPLIFALTSFVVFPMLWVGFATIRAQLFTLVFIAAQLWMQELDWRGRRAWVLMWLAMLVAWLNMHAGFVVGLGMIAFHTLERFAALSWRHGWLTGLRGVAHLIVVAPLAALATGVNPYGWSYLPYLIHAIRMPRPLIIEWQPLWNTYLPAVAVPAFVLSILFFAYSLRNISRLNRMRGAEVVAICAYMALRHIRHGSIYAIIWIAYVPAWFSRTPLAHSLIRVMQRRENYVVRVSQLVCAASLLFTATHHIWKPSLPNSPQYSTSCYPTGAVAYLRDQQFAGNLMTPFQVGSYVSWELYPAVKVSLDSRYEVAYPSEVVEPQVQFQKVQGDAWWRVLDQYDTDVVMIDANSPVMKHVEQLCAAPTVRDLPINSQWTTVYQDDQYVLLASPEWAARLPQIDRRHTDLPDAIDTVFAQPMSHWQRSADRLGN